MGSLNGNIVWKNDLTTQTRFFCRSGHDHPERILRLKIVAEKHKNTTHTDLSGDFLFLFCCHLFKKVHKHNTNAKAQIIKNDLRCHPVCLCVCVAQNLFSLAPLCPSSILYSLPCFSRFIHHHKRYYSSQHLATYLVIKQIHLSAPFGLSFPIARIKIRLSVCFELLYIMQKILSCKESTCTLLKTIELATDFRRHESYF